MTILDTHAHLDAAGGLPAMSDTTVLGTAPHVVAVTNLPSRWVRLHKIRHPQVTWALGLHPGQAHRADAIDSFVANLPQCTAIGEIGLDGTTNGPQAVPLKRQREEFDRILSEPQAADRLISVHSRRAVPQVLEHLNGRLLPGLVLHWFTGTPEQAEVAADLGAWFSVNGRMLRNARLLATLPRAQVLLETDAPYGDKAPGDLEVTVGGLAAAWGTSLRGAHDQVVENQDRLFAGLAVPPALELGT